MAQEEENMEIENDEIEERGEEDEDEVNETEDKKMKKKVKQKTYTDEMYGEEFGGEDSFYPVPTPSDLNMLLGQVDSKVVEEKSEEEKTPSFHEKEEREEEEEEAEVEEEQEEEPVEIKPDEVFEKRSVGSISSLEYGMTISEYFIKPKEKTPSEIQFENDYREIIEEKLRKLIRQIDLEDETDKKLLPERKPLEKKKPQLAEYDVSGLYPTPKFIESEVSFVFDEDEDVDKGHRGVHSDAEIIMELLRSSLKYDEDSIFAVNNREMINKVRGLVEEIVIMIRRGVTLDILQKVNDNLPYCKTNLRSYLISHLKDHAATLKHSELDEEEEGKGVETSDVPTRKSKKKGKPKHMQKIEETRAEETVVLEEEEDHVKEEITEEAIRITESEKVVTQPVVQEEESEEESEKGSDEEKQEKMEKEKKSEIPYEKIDWNKLLTESEMKLPIDPALREEMEKYIQERKDALDKEDQISLEKKMRREKFKKPKNYQEILRNLNLYVTMKFVLNTGNIFTSAYRYLMNFKEIKEDLSGVFKVPPDVLIIYRDEYEVKDKETAFDLKPQVEPFDTITLRLLTLDNDRWVLKSDNFDLPVPDIMTITVETGKNYLGVPEYKEVVVEIENRKIKKPFVGGYRDCVTGIEYHNAFSQSGPKPSKLPREMRVSRGIQTTTTVEKLINTPAEKSTQMAKKDYYVSTEHDKIITAKPYVDSDTWFKKRDFEGKVKTIQRYVRAMILRKFLKEKSEEYRKRKCWEDEQEMKRILQRERRIRDNIINMTYPKTKADFDMLYALVEKWRRAQIDRISKLKTDAPKKAELCAVLEKEIKLLEAIERHRISISKKQKQKKAMSFMNKVAAPVTWTGYRGMSIKMDTLKTQRAWELKELYLSLSRHDLAHPDRIELLISLKHALRIHCTSLTEELTSLINQECELLIRGVRGKDLEYLRQRIELLFRDFFKDPNFNPEAAKYDPMYHKEPLKSNIFCRLCHQFKHMKDFSANVRDRNVNICSACQWLHNIAVPRIDLNPYKFILKMVRKDEQKRNCYSSCAFIFQEEDMRFLVQNIWKDKSAVSESDNLLDLRMPRWDVNNDWTPWNCILLTEQEAKAHLRTSKADNYEPQLISEIISKQEMAKRHFNTLLATEKRIRDSGRWANTVDVKNYNSIPITADLQDIKPEECLKLKMKGALYEVHETNRKATGYVQYI